MLALASRAATPGTVSIDSVGRGRRVVFSVCMVEAETSRRRRELDFGLGQVRRKRVATNSADNGFYLSSPGGTIARATRKLFARGYNLRPLRGN